MWIALRLDQLPQMNSRLFDIGVMKLAGSILSGQKSTTMDVLEITARKFVSRFGISRVPLVDSQKPFCVFVKAVKPNEPVLFLGGGPVLAPCTAVIRHKVPLCD
jgi:hypothetical protein